jgi:hypothetical protein
MKAQGQAFIWLYLAMAMLKAHCFVKSDFLQYENPRSLIGRPQLLCIIPFLETLLLENLFCRPGVVFADGLSVVFAGVQ